jgi:hypothetical protein
MGNDILTALQLQDWANTISPVLIDCNTCVKNIFIISKESENGLRIIKHPFFKSMLFCFQIIVNECPVINE